MEFLGLVWAASLLNQTTSNPDMMGDSGQLPVIPAAPLVGDAAHWFLPLAQVYGWALPWTDPEAQFSSYASTQSWLVPMVTPMAALPLEHQGPVFPHHHLTAAIAPPLMTAIARDSAVPTDVGLVGDPSALPSAPADWHGWDAIAAVRIVDPTAQAEDWAGVPTGLDRAVDGSAPDLTASAACLEVPDLAYRAEPIALTAAPRLQIWVHSQYIGEVNGQVSAQRVVEKLRSRLQGEPVNPSDIRPLFGRDFAAVSINSDILFVVDETMQTHPELPAAAVAVQWVNNLRLALNAAPLDLAQVQMAMQGLQATGEQLSGTASWYGPGFHGRKTANGERFNQYDLTAAHKTLPFGTRLKVRNRLNGKTVVVRINDRGPYVGQRVLDLSKAAAQCLGAENLGVIPFEAEILTPSPEPKWEGLLTTAIDS
ncbi:MAG: septal ring lytic transglycosylase RlpA family protein [Cyanobacteria bacterium]|nr:septal ring lytic transglycosylase RlpA family protein [Cyanobacteriota bacterium]